MARRTAPWTPEELALIERERQYWLGVGMKCGPLTADEKIALVEGAAKLYKRAGRQPVKTEIVTGPRAAHELIRKWQGRPITKDDPLTYEPTWFWGQHEAYWIGWYRTAQKLGVEFTAEQEERLAEMETMTIGGWWWPFENGCVIMGRPDALHMEEFRPTRFRLHNAEGPALAYPDGYKLYAWHGVRVPEAVIITPREEITIQQVHGESNIEIRRVWMARMGLDRYIVESKAKQEQADDYGTLYRIPLDRDRSMCVVKVINGTPEPDGEGREDCIKLADGEWYKVYWLRVPSTMRTAREAVAWTYFKDRPEEYAPQIRT